MVFVEPASIDADGVVTSFGGSCFSPDAAQEWSAKPHSGLMASKSLVAGVPLSREAAEKLSAIFNSTRCQQFKFYRMT